MQVQYKTHDEVNTTLSSKWLKESRDTQWDYKNIVKRKGKLERLLCTASGLMAGTA